MLVVITKIRRSLMRQLESLLTCTSTAVCIY